MLLPTGNNIADSLARWQFDSMDKYVAYANQMIKSMGLTKTTVADASGFGDSTTSTADDLVKIGIKAMQNPVLADIVGQPAAIVPIAGDIKNINTLLGDNGVIGIKTGNTDKAGGCYLFAAKRLVQDKTVTVIGAVLGDTQLDDAINDSNTLLQASDNGFANQTIIHKGQVLANYKSAWGTMGQAKAAKDVSLLVWKGQDIKTRNQPNPIYAPVKAGTAVGSISAASDGQTAKTNLVMSQDLPGPSPLWRIFRK